METKIKNKLRHNSTLIMIVKVKKIIKYGKKVTYHGENSKLGKKTGMTYINIVA